MAGFDVWHDTLHANSSAGAFVCSLNDTQTRYHSTGIFHREATELCTKLKTSLGNGLEAYKRENREYPRGIVFYRDGVGEGEIENVYKVRSKCLLMFGNCSYLNMGKTRTIFV